MTGEPTLAELQELMSEAARRHLGQAPRGPVALLTTEPTLYDRLSTYAALGQKAALTIAVFRERAEAEEWLTAQAKATPKGGA